MFFELNLFGIPFLSLTLCRSDGPAPEEDEGEWPGGGNPLFSEAAPLTDSDPADTFEGQRYALAAAPFTTLEDEEILDFGGYL